MNKKLKKCLVVAIIFILTFVNYGLSLKAIATEGTSVFESSIFKKNNIDLKAYYDNDSKNTSKVADVNETVEITVELKPKTDGYFKSGKLSLDLESGNESNFKITSVTAESEKMDNIQIAPISQDSASEFTTTSTISGLTTNLKSSATFVKDDENSTENTVSNTVTNSVDFQASDDETLKVENAVNDTTVENVADTETVENTFEASVVENVSNTEVSENQEEQEIFINEDEVIETATQEAANEKTILQLNNEIEVSSENEITLQNIVGNIILHITIEYKNTEEINIDDLYGKINVNLEGTYINTNLEEISVAETDDLTLGWKYSKDIEISSEYIKVAPFSIVETNGTIVENEISVKREITDKNYLPIKETKIQIKVPELNGEMPSAVSITANKLMATKGEEFGNVVFDESNWNYDEKNNTIEITLTNENSGKATVTEGEDNFIVTYRYEKYIDESTELAKDVTVTVEEYSVNSNNIQTKNIKTEQTKEIDSGELITYSIGTTDGKINKGTINANYYSDEKYETEFTTIVNLNVLTSDMLEEITIKGTKENYEDKKGNTFDASEDVMYKGVSFNYQEIKPMLEKGSTIDLIDETGEVIYTLTKDNVTSSDSCKLTFTENVQDLQVRINYVETNGNISIEFTKVIVESKYVASAFSEFAKIKSSVRADIKYVGIDEEYSLKELETEKSFSESYTRANLFINKDSLSTISDNENVELKIELNNNAQTSDLYKNPSFELVFPKYVTNVDIQGMNLVNAEGLRVSDFQTYTKDGIIRVKVELQGTQNGFSTGDLTNGTNIIINTKIEVDDVTPRKEDQIKLYYCNEAVTNYESQTKWTISKNIPNEIIKQTNGFDVAVFEFKAPTGMVAISSIRNYDGNSSEIRSVKQGEISAKLERESKSQISSVGITTLNNTGNDCTDLVIVGRVPFAGNKTVTSNEDLGTTITAPMVDFIKADSSNSISSKIYYSANETANKNLDDITNGWTEDIESISEVKSYLIVTDGTLKAGEVLNYTYDVEIPENLPYETGIYGTFSVYYNNNSDVAIVYESVTADKVGLYTESGPKLNLVLTADVKENAEVPEETRIGYTITAENVGGIDFENLVLKAEIPSNALIVEKTEETIMGDYGWVSDSETKNISYEIGTLKSNESVSETFYIEAPKVLTIEEYCKSMGNDSGKDENGYYYYYDNTESDYVKKYVTEVPDTYIEMKASAESSTLSTEVESNTLSNKIVNTNWSKNITLRHDREMSIGFKDEFTGRFENTSGKDIENVSIVFHGNKYLTYLESDCNIEDVEIIYNEENGDVEYNFKKIEKDQIIKIETTLEAVNIPSGKEDFDCYYEIKSAGNASEYTTKIPQTIVKSFIKGSVVSAVPSKQVKEDESFSIILNVKNVGYSSASDAQLQFSVPEVLEIEKITYTGDSEGSLTNGNGTGEVLASLPYLESEDEITIQIDLKVKNVEGTESTNVIIEPILSNENQEDIKLEKIEFTVINDKLTEDEEEAIKKATDEEEDKKKLEKEEAEKNKTGEVLENNSSSNSQTNVNNSDSDNENNNNTEIESSDEISNENSNIVSDSKVQTSNNVENSNTVNTVESNEKYSISGVAWLDENGNGARDDEEQKVSEISVSLIDSSTKAVKATQKTDSSGRYAFNNLEAGKYAIAFSYDTDTYSVTVYKAKDVAEDKNSDVTVSNNSNLAVTTEISITDSDVENIDIGLMTSSVFDLQINKYLTHAKVTVKNKTKEYDFDNKEIAKVEIKSSELKNATVELEYTIVVENVGNVEGYVEKIVDYLGYDLTFDQDNNSIWYLGDDGNLYTKNLDNASLKPGEKREIKLILSKKMTTENTGFVSNKVEIVSSYSNSNLNENTKNNSSTQNTALSVATGKTLEIVNIFILIAMCGVFVYMVYIGKIKIPKISTKRVYK